VIPCYDRKRKSELVVGIERGPKGIYRVHRT